MKAKDLRMELLVSRWGNSLAVRLPAELAKRIGVGEGDILSAEVSADGRLVLIPKSRVIGKAEMRRMRQFIRSQKKQTLPVVEDMRRGALRATKHSRAAAKVVPAKEAAPNRSAALDEAEAFRRKLRVKGRLKIADLIAAGRR